MRKSQPQRPRLFTLLLLIALALIALVVFSPRRVSAQESPLALTHYGQAANSSPALPGEWKVTPYKGGTLYELGQCVANIGKNGDVRLRTTTSDGKTHFFNAYQGDILSFFRNYTTAGVYDSTKTAAKNPENYLKRQCGPAFESLPTEVYELFKGYDFVTGERQKPEAPVTETITL